MKRLVKIKEHIGFISTAAVGGYEEKRGPLGHLFDISDPTDKFNQNSFDSEYQEGFNLIKSFIK